MKSSIWLDATLSGAVCGAVTATVAYSCFYPDGTLFVYIGPDEVDWAYVQFGLFLVIFAPPLVTSAVWFVFHRLLFRNEHLGYTRSQRIGGTSFQFIRMAICSILTFVFPLLGPLFGASGSESPARVLKTLICMGVIACLIYSHVVFCVGLCFYSLLRCHDADALLLEPSREAQTKLPERRLTNEEWESILINAKNESAEIC